MSKQILIVASLGLFAFLSQLSPPAQAQTPRQAGKSLLEARLSAAIPAKALREIMLDAGESPYDRQPASLDDLQKLETSTLALVPAYQKATVGIQVGGGQGSGVVVSPEGHVLTAAHVVGEVGARVTIIFPDGRRHRAVVSGVDAGADAAIVRLEGRGPYPYVPMARNHFAITGRWVVAIGHPNGYHFDRLPVVRLGRVIQTTEKTVQSDCSLVGGDSGGPLFDMHGRVVGIHSRIGINNSINFHVPIQIYLRDWDTLNAGYSPPPEREQPREQKAYLGIRGRDGATAGCLITEVTPKGPAAEAGLQRGDLVTACDETPIKTFADLVTALKTRKADEEIVIHFQRAGKPQTVTVVLGGTEI